MKKFFALIAVILLCASALVIRRPVSSSVSPEMNHASADPVVTAPGLHPDPAPAGSPPAAGDTSGVTKADRADRAPGTGHHPYREAMFASAQVVETVRRGPNHQVRLLKTAHKYPWLRVDQRSALDPTTGAPIELPLVVMVADHILVQLRPGATIDDLHRLNDARGAFIRKASSGQGLYLVAFPDVDLDRVPDQVRAYRQANSVIAYAEPDYIVFATATFPNDPRFSELYGLHNTGQTGGIADADVDAPEAWDLGTGNGSVVVGVIDSGIDYRHEDLADNVWVNPGEIAGNGIDDDQNGFIDDVHGWDFANDDPDPFDDGDHGTHVSGTIAGVGNNGIGITGMSWNSKVIGLKFLLGVGFGATSDAVDAIRYATRMRQRGINIRLTNNSWGGGGYSQALLDAIVDGAAEDILFLAAAGNDATDSDAMPHYPSAYDHDCVIAVANTTDRDGLAILSNYGATTVDLSAPGSSILSTTPGNTYTVFSGTSMATPVVSGVAALMWTLDPSLSYAEVRHAILRSVDPVPALAGKVVTGGRLNARAALEQLGMLVQSSLPASGSILERPPSIFAMEFSHPVDPASIQVEDFTVNGRVPTRFATGSVRSIHFQFDTSPVLAEGLHTMSMVEDAVLRLEDGDGVSAWTGTFRYDAVPMEVVSVMPEPQARVSLPFTTLRIQFNEPVEEGSVGTDDIRLSMGRVAAASLAAPDTVVYTLAGIQEEGGLTVDLPGGALTDAHGNPSLPFTTTYLLDFDTVAVLPIEPLLPTGSLAYVSTLAGSIYSAEDADRFSLDLESNQLLTVVAEAAGGLLPFLTVIDPSGRPIATRSAAGPDRPALIQGVPVTTQGVYTVELTGVRSSTGDYELSLELNTVREEEAFLGPANDAPGQAQDLTPAFTPAGPVSRALVMGDPSVLGAGPPAITHETEPNDDGDAGGSVADLQFANDWSGSFFETDTALYHASLTGTIESGSDQDWDFFRILASPGDTIEISLLGSPSGAGSLSDPYLRLYDRDGNELESNDDFNSLESFLSYDQFAYVGDYYVVADSFGSSVGSYRLDAVMRSSNLISGITAGEDWYRFRATAGEPVSLVLAGPTSFPPDVELYTGMGLTLSAVAADAPGLGRALLQYPVAETGNLYVRVSGTRSYRLLVTRGATFSTGNNPGPAVAQDLLPAGRALGAVGPADAWFSLPVQSGDRLELSTRTPGDAPGHIENRLNPMLELYGPDEARLAVDDDGGPDDRNAMIHHEATTSGTYRVRLAASAETRGEFLLSAAGATGAMPPFATLDASPGDGAILAEAPTQLVAHLSRLVAPGTVQAGDLQIDGANSASSVTLVDGDTLQFDFPPLDHGRHVLEIPAGAFLDLSGTPSEPMQVQVDVDLIAPRLIASSVQEGDTLPMGEVTVTVAFDEPLDHARIDVTDLSLVGDHSGAWSPRAIHYDATNWTLTAEFEALADDRFALTWFSGNPGLQDLAGHALDGEPTSWPIPPNVTGDGVAGGDFAVSFDVDVDEDVLPAPFQVLSPRGAFIHQAVLSTRLGSRGDIDRYRLDLEAGQFVSLIAAPLEDTQPSVAFLDPDGAIVGAVDAPGLGLDARLPLLPVTRAGTYVIEVGAGGLTGAVQLIVLLNTGLEEEPDGGLSNEHPGQAETLDAGQVVLSAGPVTRTAVRGRPAVAPSVPPLPREIEPNDDGVAGGSAADLPFANDWSGSFTVSDLGRSSAEVTGEISIGDDVDLDFFRLGAGPGDILEIRLHGEPSGRGTLGDPYLRLFDRNGVQLAFDDDGGEGLESLIRFDEFAYEGDYYVVADSFAANVGGYTLTAEHVSPRQVNAESSGEDWYRFPMTQGEEITLVLGASGPGPLGLELHDESPRAAGIPTPDAASVIDGFVADRDGDYFARVTGTAPYVLSLVRGARYPSAPIGDPDPARAVKGDSTLLGYLETPPHASPEFEASAANGIDGKRLKFDVRAGDLLTLRTETPGDAPGAVDNTLDPLLRLIDPAGNPVGMDDNSAPDGRNAVLSHSAGSSGWYELNLTAANHSTGSGEFLVHVSGASGPGPLMRVVGTSPDQAETLRHPPSQVTLTFSDAVDLTTLDPDDLSVSGHPTTGFTVVDGRTVAYSVPPLARGVYAVWVAGDAVSNLAGQPLEPAYFLFFVEGPRIVSTSVSSGATILPGTLDLLVGFDRAMNDAELDLSDVVVEGLRLGRVAPRDIAYTSISPTGSVLRISLPSLAPDAYTLSLLSGAAQFEDEAGSPLDGEAPSSPMPPAQSGNGIAGGDFSMTFTVAWPDADGDGLLDMWEVRHNLDPNDDGTTNIDNGANGDPDQDGATNAHEQDAGTDPRDEQSRFAVLGIAPEAAGMAIRVSTQPERSYAVEFRTGTLWRPFADPGQGIGTWVETNTSPSTFTFMDDYSPETTGAPPDRERDYRVRTYSE